MRPARSQQRGKNRGCWIGVTWSVVGGAQAGVGVARAAAERWVVGDRESSTERGVGVFS